LGIKVTKEIVIKFIEMGKVTPSSFGETFESVYHHVKKCLKEDT